MNRQNPFMRSTMNRHFESHQSNCRQNSCRQCSCDNRKPCCDDENDKDKNPCILCPPGPQDPVGPQGPAGDTGFPAAYSAMPIFTP